MAKERTEMALAVLVAATSAVLSAVGAAKASVNLNEGKAAGLRLVRATPPLLPFSHTVLEFAR